MRSRVQRQLFERARRSRVAVAGLPTSFSRLVSLRQVRRRTVRASRSPGARRNGEAWGAIRCTPQRSRRPSIPSGTKAPASSTPTSSSWKLAHDLACAQGRIGMLVPSGVYTDQGTTELRKLFLDPCTWEWLYGFENRRQIFPIHSSFKFAPVVIQAGGTTAAVRAAFMRHDVSRVGASRAACDHDRSRRRCERFSPATRVLPRAQGRPDLADRRAHLRRSSAAWRLLRSRRCEVRSRVQHDQRIDELLRRAVEARSRGADRPVRDSRDPRVRAALRTPDTCRCTRASRSTCTTRTRWAGASRTASASLCASSRRRR